MNSKLNKSDWIILAIVFITTIILGCIDYYQEGNKLIEYLVDFPTTTLLSIIIIIIFIQKIIPNFLVKKKQYVLFFIVSLVVLTCIGTLDNLVGRLTAGKSLTTITEYGNLLIGGLYNAVDMASFPLGILVIKKFYEGQQELISIKEKQKENELKLLRSQIDPHFLFNNLNTLDSLIDSNTEKAKEYINRLSLIYRYLIQTKDAEVMELSEELQLAENYMFLIKTRFEDDYDFKIDTKTSIEDKFIPTGAIQTLLENVVKHNKPLNRNAIKTVISIDENMLKVSNTKSSIQSKNESFGTGLENLKSRYKLLSDKDVVIINTEQEFKISIPIIKLIKES